MFSYRHGFHAGNHADVLKHVVLVQMLAQLSAKDKPLWVVDTHAGAGAYSLRSSFARKKGEFKEGIGRLWGRNDLPPALLAYLEQVKILNPDGALGAYPGSPQIALQMTRPQDHLRLFELHSTESRILQDHFRGAGRRVAVREADGFVVLKSLLPPPSRRGLVLMDPSYEDKSDYARVQASLRDALQRFPTGVYAVWYPQVQRPESRALPGLLEKLATDDWLHVWLKVSTPAKDGLGLHGSGMFVFNPPWKLAATLGTVMPALVKLLGQDPQASYGLKFRQN
ncbi:MAG: 23S rRNA (adenine(2030)-N(6))-methyltransferase RlmJ [Betaproteobacteria bacterium]|nr:23S rRNA (adenine(2030)-N(6))-methyltransferase RlmJ [Betaproteobacteria bacterium]